jgi:photoactive yellow protein
MDGSAGTLSYGEITLAALEAAPAGMLDTLLFGVVGLNHAGEVEVYNATESRLAGLSRESVLGQHFFVAVGPCMNNALVAGRFESERVLDATVPYVLTFRMRPTPVTLRLLQEPGVRRRYILIQR